jgi:hypothetical protein
MRRRSIATALVVLTAGLTATALRRMATRRRTAAPAPAAVPAAVPVPRPEAPAEPDAVVLQFTRPAAAAPAAPAVPARCGDSGGLTRAGAPCAARATSGGRCHHHPIAA